jgi:hypothetical protein
VAYSHILNIFVLQVHEIDYDWTHSLRSSNVNNAFVCCDVEYEIFVAGASIYPVFVVYPSFVPRAMLSRPQQDNRRLRRQILTQQSTMLDYREGNCHCAGKLTLWHGTGRLFVHE